MPLSEDVGSVLEELNYPAAKEVKLESLSLIGFSKIVHWISKQLHFFAKTDSIVHAIQDNSDLVSLNVELNSLFKEVDSLYSDSFSLTNTEERLNILHSLCGDLLAARLTYIKQQKNEDYSTNLNPRKDLSTINSCLSIPNDIKDTKLYFQRIKEKLEKNLLKFQQEDNLLLPDNKNLTDQQWAELKRLNEAFYKEYSIRREMLLRRADTTVNSFSWKSDSTREINKDLLKKVHSSCREKLSVSPGITLANALAARSSDCNALINDMISTTHISCLIDVPSIINKANQGTQQRLQLHKYLIGSVPDRGGRPGEQPTPSRETFNQQQGQRENASNRRGGGRGQQRDNNYQRGNYNNQRTNVPDQTNRLQNAGWQQRGGGGQQHHNYQGGRGQNYQDDYDQYQGGHDRFTGGHNQYQGRGGGRGGGNRNSRY